MVRAGERRRQRPRHSLSQIVHQRAQKRTRHGIGAATGAGSRRGGWCARSSGRTTRTAGTTCTWRWNAEWDDVGRSGCLVDDRVAAIGLTPALESVVEQAQEGPGVALRKEFALWMRRRPDVETLLSELVGRLAGLAEVVELVARHHDLAVAPHALQLAEISLAGDVLLHPGGGIIDLVRVSRVALAVVGQAGAGGSSAIAVSNFRPVRFDVLSTRVVLITRRMDHRLGDDLGADRGPLRRVLVLILDRPQGARDRALSAPCVQINRLVDVVEEQRLNQVRSVGVLVHFAVELDVAPLHLGEKFGRSRIPAAVDLQFWICLLVRVENVVDEALLGVPAPRRARAEVQAVAAVFTIWNAHGLSGAVAAPVELAARVDQPFGPVAVGH